MSLLWSPRVRELYRIESLQLPELIAAELSDMEKQTLPASSIQIFFKPPCTQNLTYPSGQNNFFGGGGALLQSNYEKRLLTSSLSVIRLEQLSSN